MSERPKVLSPFPLRDWGIVVTVVTVAAAIAAGIYALVRWAVTLWGTGIWFVDAAATFVITWMMLSILVRDVSPRLRRRVERRRMERQWRS